MNKVRIISQNKKIFRKIPARWDELTPRQLLFIAPRLLSNQPLVQIKDEILIKLLRISNKHLRRLNLSQVNGLHRALNFLWREITPIENPVPVIRLRMQKYTGPRYKMKDISFGQFIYADTFFLRYMSKKDPGDLDKLVATLYCRGEFKASRVDLTAHRRRRYSVAKKQAILLFFMAGRRHMIDCFPLLFPKKAEAEQEKKGTFSWGDVLIALVADYPHEKDKVEKLDVYFAFRYLEEQIRKSNELKKKLNKR